ncbi:MAG: 2-succinylbenzoate--CoA ligase [Prochloraceae cyanobacterium]|nr:2-succinylbenzoate--CoA ligase [Prochloraceae cyanobacterium]
MEELLRYLQQRGAPLRGSLRDRDWLIGYDIEEFNSLTEQLFAQLTRFSTPPKVILAQENPLEFLASFLAAVIANCSVFLCNPNWGQLEWEQVSQLVQPDLILGRVAIDLKNTSHPKPSTLNPTPHNLISIPTGGSSGKIRFAMHTWETLTASVKGFHQYFGDRPVNSFCVLPLYHVSGLMQFIRSFLTGGNLLIFPYKLLKSGKIPKIDPRDFFISLVPTQLQFLLQSDPGWLSQFHAVLLGGAPMARSLLDTARKYNIPLAPTYGMTETASQIVTLKPEDFLAGNNSSGRVLPHADVTIRSNTGDLLNSDRTGTITIKADSLCLGYYPNIFSDRKYFYTDDLGYFDAEGYLNIVGRNSQKIISGGENVFPPEVEAAILATQLVEDVCVIGLPDEKWGQVVIAVCVPKQKEVFVEDIKTAIGKKLSKFKQPKYWLEVEKLPRCDRGKINYQQIQKIAARRKDNNENT